MRCCTTWRVRTLPPELIETETPGVSVSMQHGLMKLYREEGQADGLAWAGAAPYLGIRAWGLAATAHRYCNQFLSRPPQYTRRPNRLVPHTNKQRVELVPVAGQVKHRKTGSAPQRELACNAFLFLPLLRMRFVAILAAYFESRAS
jgi:hypothetical protein